MQKEKSKKETKEMYDKIKICKINNSTNRNNPNSISCYNNSLTYISRSSY